MKAGATWELRRELWERAKELMEDIRTVYQGAEFAAQFGEATVKGSREVRDGSEAQRRKPN